MSCDFVTHYRFPVLQAARSRLHLGLALALLSLPATTVFASSPVTAITTTTSAGASNSYATTWYGGGASEGQALGTPVTLNFSGEVRRLASISTASGTLPLGRGVASVVVRRNLQFYGDGRENRIPLRFEANDASIGPVVNLDAPYADTLESALLFGAVNIGADNLFVNAFEGVQQQSNVERVDFLFSAPLSNLSAAQLQQATIPVFDSAAAAGGSDAFKIAGLRGASGSCVAPVLGPLVVSGTSGPLVSTASDNHSLTARREGADTVMRPLANRGQGITGQAFSLQELGYTSADTVCGFALLANDSTGPDAENPAQNPVLTGNADGGLDLVAATGLFLVALPPTAQDNTSTYPAGLPITLDVLQNDQKGLNDLNPATVVFVNPPVGAALAPDGKSLNVPNEGNWTVDPSTGAVTFTPLPSFVGNPTPVQYTVSDTTNPTPLVSNPATVTLTTIVTPSQPPVANDNTSTYPAGSPITLDVLQNDQKGLNDLDPATVVFVNPPAGSTLAPGGKSLTVPNEGTWTIDPVTGAMTFTPLPSFVGNPTPVQYTVSDTTNPTPLISNPATVTLTTTVHPSQPAAVPVGPWWLLTVLLGVSALWVQRRESLSR